eukprot:SAG25_NODE_138_length_14172_cov_11.875364_11_plen_191_part_00
MADPCRCRPFDVVGSKMLAARGGLQMSWVYRRVLEPLHKLCAVDACEVGIPAAACTRSAVSQATQLCCACACACAVPVPVLCRACACAVLCCATVCAVLCVAVRCSLGGVGCERHSLPRRFEVTSPSRISRQVNHLRNAASSGTAETVGLHAVSVSHAPASRMWSRRCRHSSAPWPLRRPAHQSSATSFC